MEFKAGVDDERVGAFMERIYSKFGSKLEAF